MGSLKLLAIYLGSFFLGTVLFFLLLWSPIMDNTNELFFRAGILMLMSTTCLFFILGSLLKQKMMPFNFTWRDALIICILFFFIHWNFYGMVPFNVSRSNSLIILGYLDKSNGSPKTKEQIESFTKQKYFNEYDSVGIRLNEQSITGNIIKTDDGRYVITERGKLVASYFREISDAYNIQNNFLD